MESRKNTNLQSLLDQSEMKTKDLERENEMLKQKLRLVDSEGNLKDSKLSTNMEQKFKSMLVYDYHLLNSILKNLDDTIKEID